MLTPGRLTQFVLLAATFVHGAAVAQSSTATITGRVVDAATGQPIVGASVTLSVAAGGPLLPPTRPSETNADGVFSIPDVPLGRWHVRVQKIGFFMVGGGVRGPVIDVAANGTLPDINLARGGAIAGRVLDARSRPASDISVTALQRPAGHVVMEETNDLGEFRLAGLPAGEYVVVARPRIDPSAMNGQAASRTVVVETYYHGATELRHATPFTVTPGATTSAFDLQMLSVPAYQVSGVVMDVSGRAAAGARLELVPVPGTPRGSPLRATTGPDGTFQIASVPVGVYLIDVTAGLESMRSDRVVVDGGDVTGLRVVVVP